MDFRDRPEFQGRTVNERLSAAGLIAAWDEACRKLDRDQMIALLRRVVSDDQAASTADAVIARPDVYLEHLRRAT